MARRAKREEPVERVVVSYERTGDQLHVRTKGMTNHELREVLVGFWAALAPSDRVDHILELQHYEVMLQQPSAYANRHLSPLAEAIRDGLLGEPHRDRLRTEQVRQRPEDHSEGITDE